MIGSGFLLLSLNLVIARNDLRVGRRRWPIAGSFSTVVCVVRLRCGSRRGAGRAGGSVVHVALNLGLPRGLGLAKVRALCLSLDKPLLLVAMRPVYKDVDAAVLGVYRTRVVIVGIGELGDDVPCVEEAGNVAKNEEQDVDYRVGGADSTLDPDRQRREEDGYQGEEAVCGAHCVRVVGVGRSWGSKNRRSWRMFTKLRRRLKGDNDG